MDHSESEHEDFRSRHMPHAAAIFCPHDFLAKPEPAPHLLRRTINRARPTAPGQGTFEIREHRVVSKRQQNHRAFGEG